MKASRLRELPEKCQKFVGITVVPGSYIELLYIYIYTELKFLICERYKP